jgi:hypothetical protein
LANIYEEMTPHFKWLLLGLSLLLSAALSAQTPGTFKVRKKVEPPVLLDPLDLDRLGFDADTDSFITRDRPHTLAISGRIDLDDNNIFSKATFRYGYYATPNIAMGVDVEQKWYNDVYVGPTIGPFVRFDKYILINPTFGLPLFTEIGYQISLLRASPEATSSLGFREIDFGFGYTFIRWLDKGFFIDLKGGWVFTTSEARYEKFGSFAPSLRLNFSF